MAGIALCKFTHGLGLYIRCFFKTRGLFSVIAHRP